MSTDKDSADPLVAQLVAARKAAGMSQRGLASAMGTVQSHVWQLENGTQVHGAGLTVLRRWAQVFGLQPALVPLDYETAPAVACTPAGNGATEGGPLTPPDAPASSPTPTDVGDGCGPDVGFFVVGAIQALLIHGLIVFGGAALFVVVCLLGSIGTIDSVFYAFFISLLRNQPLLLALQWLLFRGEKTSTAPGSGPDGSAAASSALTR